MQALKPCLELRKKGSAADARCTLIRREFEDEVGSGVRRVMAVGFGDRLASAFGVSSGEMPLKAVEVAKMVIDHRVARVGRNRPLSLGNRNGSSTAGA